MARCSRRKLHSPFKYAAVLTDIVQCAFGAFSTVSPELLATGTVSSTREVVWLRQRVWCLSSLLPRPNPRRYSVDRCMDRLTAGKLQF